MTLIDDIIEFCRLRRQHSRRQRRKETRRYLLGLVLHEKLWMVCNLREMYIGLLCRFRSFFLNETILDVM